MAVVKAAIPVTGSIVAAAAACREALEAKVAELTETIASLPAATAKRRLKGAVIVMPNGFAPEVEIECKEEKPAPSARAAEEFL